MRKRENTALLDGISYANLKIKGGLGIHDLNIKNTTLLSKWLFKLLTSDGIWQ
jgi:hypothetical protein